MEATLRGQSASIRSPPALEVGKNAARLPLTDYYLAADMLERVRKGEEAVHPAADVRADLGLDG